MAGQVPTSPRVEIYMTEEAELFTKWEHTDSQQGSSLEGALFSFVPSTRAVSHTGARPSIQQVGEEEVDSDEIEVVCSEDLDVVKLEGTHGATDVEPMVEERHPREGILLKNPRLKVTEKESRKLRYLYKIPQSVEIRAPKAHERVDWVVPGYVAFDEIVFRHGIRLPISKLVRDVLDHYEIAPSLLILNN